MLAASRQAILDFYSRPAMMTAAGGCAPLIEGLPREAPALMELLPWDDWGAMPGPDEPLSAEQLAFFDELAALTRARRLMG